MVCELTLLRIVVVDCIEQLSIEVRPLLESELLAEDTRAHIVSNKRGLYEQSTRTTHRINKVGLTTPTCHKNHTCSKHFVKRSFNRLLTIATTMKRLAT